MLAWVVSSRSPLCRARKSNALHVLHRSARRSLSLPRPFPFSFSLLRLSYLFSFQILAHSFARNKNSTLFFSFVSALFVQNTRGWGRVEMLTSYPSSRCARGLRGNPSSACVSLQYPSPVLLFTDHRALITGPLLSKSFTIGTHEKCACNPFRIYTYKKRWGRG